MATRRSGQLKNWRTPTFIAPRGQASVRDCGDHGVRQPRDPLDVVAVLHDARRKEREPEIAHGVDPEGGRAGADAAERARAAEIAERAGDDAVAADEEAEADRR